MNGLVIGYGSLNTVIQFEGATYEEGDDISEEKEMMYDTFGKIVDPEVRDYLMKETHKIKRGGEVREVTVLFCDIRNFTAMSEKMSASSVVSLLTRIAISSPTA